MDEDRSQDTALEQDDQEWGDALNDFSESKGVKVEADEDTDTETEDTSAEDTADDTADDAEGEDTEDTEDSEEEGEETDEEKAERERQEAAAEAEAEARRQAREVQRDLIAEQETMRQDIFETMFKEYDGKLRDADGDEIRGYEDVMKLHNPATGQPFTEEEAATWFIKASQHAKQQREEAIQKATMYADINIAVKEEADAVKSKYGKFLNDPKNHQLRDEILQDYLNTLVTDEQTGVITKAPVSMLRFYERTLTPYMKTQQQSTAAEQAKAEAEERARKAEEAARQARQRSDREDIFSRGKNERHDLSEEEEEWGEVMKDYYGKR